MTEKPYCCGYTVVGEAKLIAKFDLVLSILGFLALTIFTIVLVSSPGTFAEMAQNNPENRTDFAAFVQWPGEAQGGLIIYLMFSFLSGTALAILLLIGASRRSHGMLLTWFITTIVLCVIEFVGAIVGTMFSNEKKMKGFSILIVVLYKWYCLWIVKLLMKEIRSVAEGYINALDMEIDGPSQELDKY